MLTEKIEYRDKDLYLEMNEEDLLNCIQSDDIEAINYLIDRYEYLVRIKARKYFLIGGDMEDLLQEGRIGIFNAIETYNVDKGVPFKYFASICIESKLKTALTKSNRQKHKPLNTAYSIDKPLYKDESNICLLDFLISEKKDGPEEKYISTEKVKLLEEIAIDRMSDLEYDVYEKRRDGWSYDEISKELDIDLKSIDNALQRARKKIIDYLKNK